MLSFRNVTDLNASIIEALPSLPRDLALIAAIPRSGMLAASLISLYMNIPMTDIEGLLEGRLIASGNRALAGAGCDDNAVSRCKVLVIDDSVGHGTQLRNVKARLAHLSSYYDFLYGAVYVTPESRGLVDFAFEILPWGHCFAWNVMHHELLDTCCVDIDGVICEDPTGEQDDGGARYRSFLENARPLFIPTVNVGWLVTSRLEKYRSETERWLKDHGVRYSNLVMMPSHVSLGKDPAKARARYKAAAYVSSKATLFIESCPIQAQHLTEFSGEEVLCIATQQMLYPSMRARLPAVIRNSPRSVPRKLRSGLRSIVRRFHDTKTRRADPRTLDVGSQE